MLNLKYKGTLLFYDRTRLTSATCNLCPFNGQARLKWPGGAWEIWHGTNFILSTLNQVQPRSPNWISRGDNVDNVNWVIAGGTGAVQLDQGKAPGARPFWPRDATIQRHFLQYGEKSNKCNRCDFASSRGSEAIWVLQAIFISSFAKRQRSAEQRAECGRTRRCWSWRKLRRGWDEMVWGWEGLRVEGEMEEMESGWNGLRAKGEMEELSRRM